MQSLGFESQTHKKNTFLAKDHFLSFIAKKILSYVRTYPLCSLLQKNHSIFFLSNFFSQG